MSQLGTLKQVELSVSTYEAKSVFELLQPHQHYILDIDTD